MVHPFIRHPMRLLAGVASTIFWPLRWVCRRGWYGLTAFGKYLLVAFLVAAAASLVSLHIPIFYLSVTLLFMFTGAFFYAWFFSPRLGLAAKCPQTVTAGETCTLVAELENMNSVTGYEIFTGFNEVPRHITLLECGPIAIGGRDSATFKLEIVPEFRGRYLLGELKAFTLFPFGFFRWQISAPSSNASSTSITVLPQFHRLEHLELPFNRDDSIGLKLAKRSGQSIEYFGSRDYRPGESVRRFEHRAWARLGKPAVREYELENRDSIVLFLDTCLPKAGRTTRRRSEKFEAAVSITAALADHLSEQNRMDGCLICGKNSIHEPGGSITLNAMLEALCTVEHETNSVFEPSASRVAESECSRFVIVLLDWDGARRELVKRLIDRGAQAKVVLVSEEHVDEYNLTEDLHSDNLNFITIEAKKICSGEATSI
ncbi:MAG: DUF58 domain-containing protein [Planctomycetota bacterium]|nr:DUF58 domain-containing protein [Planctomycetota bacterium]